MKYLSLHMNAATTCMQFYFQTHSSKHRHKLPGAVHANRCPLRARCSLLYLLIWSMSPSGGSQSSTISNGEKRRLSSNSRDLNTDKPQTFSVPHPLSPIRLSSHLHLPPNSDGGHCGYTNPTQASLNQEISTYFLIDAFSLPNVMQIYNTTLLLFLYITVHAIAEGNCN